MKNKMVILLIASAFLLTSCQAVFKAFVGFKPMERFDQGKYKAFIRKLPKDVPFTSLVSSVEQSLEVIEFDTAKHAKDFTVGHQNGVRQPKRVSACWELSGLPY